MNPSPRICLITPGHVASTPRLVKSADALVEAGYKVHVLSGAPYPPADRLDAEILSAARWEHTRVNTRKGLAVIFRKIVRKAARRLLLAPGLGTLGLSARAHLAEAAHLGRAAARVRADLYIGHSLGGLYAAARAARAVGRDYGFDLEDYHDAETKEALADPVECRARRVLQSQLLPHCRVLTCAAPLITRQYVQAYKVSATTVLNVFPLSQRPRQPEPAHAVSEQSPAVFYWFSQTVGSGRGLESVIRIMAKMRLPTQLHLRGFVSDDYRRHLESLARSEGLKNEIQFLKPGSPSEMARLAATADLGLSVEESEPLNHDICLPNKVFVYLLAGIPQLMSATQAFRSMAPEFPHAALVGDLIRAAETAAQLDSFFRDPPRVAAARRSAWHLAETRFCWDLERAVLIGCVRAALPLSP